jgi:preprotein translocase subunit SecG
MITVVLVIHLLIATALVGVILIQRSEGGALSGLGGGTFGGLMSTRGTANLLTRSTAILAACFIGTSLLLAILASHSRSGGSILDRAPAATAPAPAPAAPAPAAPAAPGEPAAPIAQ